MLFRSAIGDYAFSGCVALTEMVLPNNVISIGDSAFSGCVSLTACELPDGYKSAGLMEVRQYQLSRKIHLEMKAEKGNCLIGFQNGEEYAYEKKTLQTFFGATPKKPLGSRNESGVIMAVPVSLTDELDGVASSILQKKVKAKDYLDPSPSLIERM